MPIDVQALACDFYPFSGHKIFGPTGIGALFVREDVQAQMPPFMGGGAMIKRVSFDGTTYGDPPERFEAGTPHIAGAIGMGVACGYLSGLDLRRVAQYETELLRYALEGLASVPGLKIYGRAPNQAAVIAFNIEGIHGSDLGMIVDQQGIALRTGHHCTQPLMGRLGTASVARASFAFYNRRSDVDALVEALGVARELFAP